MVHALHGGKRCSIARIDEKRSKSLLVALFVKLSFADSRMLLLAVHDNQVWERSDRDKASGGNVGTDFEAIWEVFQRPLFQDMFGDKMPDILRRHTSQMLATQYFIKTSRIRTLSW